MCVVCVGEREGKREKENERQRERKRDLIERKRVR